MQIWAPFCCRLHRGLIHTRGVIRRKIPLCHWISPQISLRGNGWRLSKKNDKPLFSLKSPLDQYLALSSPLISVSFQNSSSDVEALVLFTALCILPRGSRANMVVVRMKDTGRQNVWLFSLPLHIIIEPVSSESPALLMGAYRRCCIFLSLPHL